jgi:hypothetical protein
VLHLITRLISTEEHTEWKRVPETSPNSALNFRNHLKNHGLSFWSVQVTNIKLFQQTSLTFSSSLLTERGGRMVNTPASYSRGLGFKSRPEDRLSWLRVFVVFPSPSKRIIWQYLKISPRPLSYKSFPNHYCHTFIPSLLLEKHLK